MNKKLQGTGVALVTPFEQGGKIDYPALERLIEYNIHGGVEYLVVLGTTGESATLSKEEKNELTHFVLEVNKGRLPIVLGLGGNNTAEILQSIESRDFNGISAILSVSPYYNKPSQEGIYQHYKAIAGASPVPVILYNVPGRTGSNITAETTLRLAGDFSNITAIKEASGNFTQIMEIIKNKASGFMLISGDDNLTFPMMVLGAEGVISVTGQAYPRMFSDMVRNCLNHNFKDAADLHYRLFEFTNCIFMDGSPGGIKCALESMGICSANLRLPLVAPNARVKELIQSFILENPPS